MEKVNLYLILHANLKESDSFRIFKENITNNYLSKVVSDSSIIISTKTEKSAHEVFEKLGAGISEEEQNNLEIFITAMSDFYGSLPDSAWEWIEAKSDIKLIK